MHDIDGVPEQEQLGHLLRELVADAPTALPLPYETLRRKGQARRRRRHGVLAALCGALVVSGGVLLLPGGPGPEQLSSGPVPVVTAFPSATLGSSDPTGSATPTTPVSPLPATTLPPLPAPETEEPGPTPLPPGQVRAVVDLSSRTLVMAGETAVRPCRVGAPGRPTPKGRMTVVSRQRIVVRDSTDGPFLTLPGETWYHLELRWAVRLAAPDGRIAWVAETPGSVALGGSGAGTGTERDIGLVEQDARRFFESVAVGDTVDIRA
ncbi:L,D-transpeptidase family protein [Kitasatospora sp. NPDC096147]|uniref:L,D-transpeptidase n=1 Tax=Kitasatospora sp. NPDC096147 TaxID=3364093 RepID=UPI0038272EE7